MRFGILFFCRLALLLLIVFGVAAAQAQETKPHEIPTALQPWVNWALWNDRELDCPPAYDSAGRRLCVWPTRLTLQVEKAGGKFTLEASIFSKTWLSLPGGAGAWPADVTANGGRYPVVEHAGAPAVQLEPGVYKVEGVYRWNEMPQSLAIPREIGVLSLSLEGQPVEVPTWDVLGQLWLRRTSSVEGTEKDYLTVKVYSVLEDGIPLWWRSQVELMVSGKSREEQIGAVLPEGWKLSAVDSPIPVAIDAQGALKAQVRAGKWIVKLSAFRADNPKEVAFGKEPQPAVEEQIVGFRAQPDLRSVEIAGPPSIDVSQTTFPAEWRDLPVYRWEIGGTQPTTVRIEERLRGMGEKKVAGLAIERTLWLDEHGSGYTFSDHLSGSMQQIWRLDVAPGQQLGSVRAKGEGQLITKNPTTGASGVEIRQRDLRLEAAGRLARTASLPASGWSTDAESVKVTLNLPPGWRLFALFGADHVEGDWLTAWSLLDLFLLLVFALAVFRLWGWGPGLLALAAFGLSYHEPGAPRLVWLFLLAPLALLRVVPEGRGRTLVEWWKGISILAFVLIAVPFIGRQIQSAIYPQLEFGTRNWGSAGVQTEAAREFEPPQIPATMGAPAPADMAEGLTQKVQQKLEQVVIPKIELRDATVREALDYWQQQVMANDPEHQGINLVLQFDVGTTPAPAAPVIPGLEPVPGAATQPVPSAEDARITVSLANIPAGEALRYITGLANLKFKIEQNAVAVVSQSMPTDVLVTKEWKVPPNLLLSSDGAKRKEAKEYLMEQGVTFPPGASAIFLAPTSRLVVKNTQENLDLVDAIVEATGTEQATRGWAVPGRAVTKSGSARSHYSVLGSTLSYDSEARIQTGPGVPEWTWRRVSFGWNGPVQASQTVRPVLISLGLERVLMLLRVALTVLLAGWLFRVRGGAGKSAGPAVAKVAALIVAVALTSGTTRAEGPIPSDATLKALRERFLETSDAFPHTAEIPNVSLTLNDRRVVMDAEIHAATRVAVPLPGKLLTWSPLSVTIDDKPEPALRRDGSYLWVVLGEGIHRVHLEAMLPVAKEWEWTAQLAPRHVQVQAPGWTVKGIRPGGLPESVVLFTREEKPVAGAVTYDRPEVQSIVLVNRQFHLGLTWQVRTTLSPLTPPGKAIAVRIPLIPGERVLSSATVKDGFVEARLGPNQRAMEWQSSLPVAPTIDLATRADDTWVERWEVVASPVWNVALSGLPPVFEPGQNALVPVWQPWPGEKVTLSVTRPDAIPGATMTVNRAAHQLTLGRRQRASQLDLVVRSSLGQDFLVALPGGEEITGLTLDGKNIPVRKEGAQLIVPLHPGEQPIALKWKTNEELGLRVQGEAVKLPVESANVQTRFSVPEDRWVLWAAGPQRGPAVRFWGIFALALLAGVALSRMPLSPLRLVEWVLLAIGLTQVPLIAALVVIGWLLLLAWRGSARAQALGAGLHNTFQVLLILLTVGALGVLIFAVGEGLLGRPEMFIEGNGSSISELRWFQPRAEAVLPQPTCVSVSIWWYRLMMLLWALWLAAALIRWLQWAWRNFSLGGVFRGGPKKEVTTPKSVAVTAETSAIPPPPPPPPAPAP